MLFPGVNRFPFWPNSSGNFTSTPQYSRVTAKSFCKLADLSESKFHGFARALRYAMMASSKQQLLIHSLGRYYRAEWNMSISLPVRNTIWPCRLNYVYDGFAFFRSISHVKIAWSETLTDATKLFQMQKLSIWSITAFYSVLSKTYFSLKQNS